MNKLHESFEGFGKERLLKIHTS